MKEVPAVFLGGPDGCTATGHHTLCPVCNNDTFQINVIYLSNGDHTHISCTECGACYCDSQCVHGQPVGKPEDN